MENTNIILYQTKDLLQRAHAEIEQILLG